MTGRFGKYGDLKRKANLRRSRITRNRMDQLRQRSQGQRWQDAVKPRSRARLRIEIEITDSDTSPPPPSDERA